MASGYDNIYDFLLPQLKQCDIPAQATLLGLRPGEDGCAYADFLGRTYRITNSGVDVTDGGEAVHINNRSLLIYYILSEGRVEPRQSFVPITRLTGTIEGRNSQDGWFISDRLLSETRGNYEVFAAAAREMGGEYVGIVGGGHCWQFAILPKIPVRLVFFEADAEFPAEFQFLMDETAPYYMGFECLAFLSGCVMHELRRIVKNLGKH